MAKQMLMQKIVTYLKKPFEAKGLFIGVVDTCLKAVTVFVWGYLTVVLCSLFFTSLMVDYNPLTKLWWFSYCFFIFFGATLLAYILLFVRSYDEEDA